jgi:hypothetical protein
MKAGHARFTTEQESYEPFALSVGDLTHYEIKYYMVAVGPKTETKGDRQQGH